MTGFAASSVSEPLLRIEEVAQLLNVAPQTMRNWRCVGKGPVAIVIGRSLRWRRSVVTEWVEAREEPRVNG